MKGRLAKIFTVLSGRRFGFAAWLGILVLCVSPTSISRAATALQLLSARAPVFGVPAGGNGNSDLPIVSADGRYVLFVSTAGNLANHSNPGPASGLAPQPLQVFVRDRVAGTTTLVSANPAGSGGNGDSFPDAISTNGQYVLFESSASDIVSQDTNNATDIFLRDLVNHTTTLVSVNLNGGAAGGNSYNATMTPDGRFVAFVSAAADVVASDTNGIPDVFVRDRLAGTTVLASVGAMSTGWSPLPATSDSPDITPDGRFVAFYSTATNLLPGLTNTGQIFIRDLAAGKTIWASTNAQSLYLSAYLTGGGICGSPLISTDGVYVAFEVGKSTLNITPASGLLLRYNRVTGLTDEVATNAIVPAPQFANINSRDTLDMTPDGQYIAFVVSVAAPAVTHGVEVWSAASGTVTMASQNLAHGVTSGDLAAWPRLDATGRYVAFVAGASNLTPNPASGYNCYRRDLTGATTSLICVGTNGAGPGVSLLTPPSVSGDGSVIAFVAGNGSLVTNDDNGVTDVYVRNVPGAVTEPASARDPGLPDAAANGLSGFSSVSVSSNGLWVAFASEAGDLAPKDTNSLPDVFVRDVADGTNILVSVNTNGVAAGGVSLQPSISADGRYVAFSSTATDLTKGDTNNSRDIFLRDLQAGTNALVSRDSRGTGEGNGDSYSPVISADGRYVLYDSLAQNLAPGTFTAGTVNLYLRDLQLGTNYVLTYGGVSSAVATPDGHRVAFVGVPSGATAKLYVWDTLQKKLVYTNSSSTIPVLDAISPDGNLVAYVDTTLKVANLLSNTVTVVSATPFSITFGTAFSGDGRYLVYSTTAANSGTDANSRPDIYQYDFQSKTNTLISRSYLSGAAPNGTSHSPVISPDGRFIAYITSATNSVPADLNDVPDLLLYDRSNAMALLVTPSAAGNWTANNRSYEPVFSADSKSLIFASWASDLTAPAQDHGNNVFRLALGDSSVSTTNSDGSPVIVSDVQLQWLPAANPALNWPAASGTLYQVQYKDDLTDPVWHELTGATTISGDAAQAFDLAPSVANRFYRVVLSN